MVLFSLLCSGCGSTTTSGSNDDPRLEEGRRLFEDDASAGFGGSAEPKAGEAIYTIRLIDVPPELVSNPEVAVASLADTLQGEMDDASAAGPAGSPPQAT